MSVLLTEQEARKLLRCRGDVASVRDPMFRERITITFKLAPVEPVASVFREVWEAETERKELRAVFLTAVCGLLQECHHGKRWDGGQKTKGPTLKTLKTCFIDGLVLRGVNLKSPDDYASTFYDTMRECSENSFIEGIDSDEWHPGLDSGEGMTTRYVATILGEQLVRQNYAPEKVGYNPWGEDEKVIESKTPEKNQVADNRPWQTQLYDELVNLHDKAIDLDNLIRRSDNREEIDISEIHAVFKSLDDLLNSEYWVTTLKEHENEPRYVMCDETCGISPGDPYYGDAIDFYKAVNLFHGAAEDQWERHKHLGGHDVLLELTSNGSDINIMFKIEEYYEAATSYLIYEDGVLEHAKKRGRESRRAATQSPKDSRVETPPEPGRVEPAPAEDDEATEPATEEAVSGLTTEEDQADDIGQDEGLAAIEPTEKGPTIEQTAAMVLKPEPFRLIVTHQTSRA